MGILYVQIILIPQSKHIKSFVPRKSRFSYKKEHENPEIQVAIDKGLMVTYMWNIYISPGQLSLDLSCCDAK